MEKGIGFPLKTGSRDCLAEIPARLPGLLPTLHCLCQASLIKDASIKAFYRKPMETLSKEAFLRELRKEISIKEDSLRKPYQEGLIKEGIMLKGLIREAY